MGNDRRQTTQTIAWFWDLHRRELLELDPPYQRRSVWSQSYKDYFIDTILLDYPAPAIFLYEDIDEDGLAEYSVVDGKQRLSTVFGFLSNEFPVSDAASITGLRGRSFVDLPADLKRAFYNYEFAIEFLPTTDAGTLSNIFDRINRNVARLSPQELRHARFEGQFATKAEDLEAVMAEALPQGFPRIATASKRQMKDVEFVAQLMLLTERGVDTYSQADLDTAYSDREDEWDESRRVHREFSRVVARIGEWAEELLAGEARRLRNQADFYSLYGAVLELQRSKSLPDDDVAVERLEKFMKIVNNEDERQKNPETKRYFEAARSASNDVAQRRDRIRILKAVLTGEDLGGGV